MQIEQIEQKEENIYQKHVELNNITLEHLKNLKQIIAKKLG